MWTYGNERNSLRGAIARFGTVGFAALGAPRAERALEALLANVSGGHFLPVEHRGEKAIPARSGRGHLIVLVAGWGVPYLKDLGPIPAQGENWAWDEAFVPDPNEETEKDHLLGE